MYFSKVARRYISQKSAHVFLYTATIPSANLWQTQHTWSIGQFTHPPLYPPTHVHFILRIAAVLLCTTSVTVKRSRGQTRNTLLLASQKCLTTRWPPPWAQLARRLPPLKRPVSMIMVLGVWVQLRCFRCNVCRAVSCLGPCQLHADFVFYGGQMYVQMTYACAGRSAMLPVVPCGFCMLVRADSAVTLYHVHNNRLQSCRNVCSSCLCAHVNRRRWHALLHMKKSIVRRSQSFLIWSFVHWKKGAITLFVWYCGLGIVRFMFTIHWNPSLSWLEITF